MQYGKASERWICDQCGAVIEQGRRFYHEREDPSRVYSRVLKWCLDCGEAIQHERITRREWLDEGKGALTAEDEEALLRHLDEVEDRDNGWWGTYYELQAESLLQ